MRAGGEHFAVSHSVSSRLARNHVIQMTDRKSLDLDVATPRILEMLDSIGRKHEVHVKGPALELDKSFALFDICGLLICKRKSKLPEGRHEGSAIGWRSLGENVRILGGIGESEQNRRGFPKEEVPHTVPSEGIPDLLSLPIVKRGHSRARTAGSLHTSDGTLP